MSDAIVMTADECRRVRNALRAMTQLYTPHVGHGLRLSGPDELDPESFSAEPDDADLAPYQRDRRTVDGDEEFAW